MYHFLLPLSLLYLLPLSLYYTRRGFSTDPALLLRGFRPPRRANRGLAPVPYHLLKKVDENFIVQIPVAIGALGGLLFGARLVDICLKKAPRATYMAILGLVLGSILSVVDRAGFSLFTAEEAAAIITALAGIAISLLMSSKKMQALTGGAEEA